MKVQPEKLAAEMSRQLSPIYVVSGDDPLLVQETCDTVRRGLREAGYTERELFHVEANYDWGDVLFSANSMSLFAEKKILEIRMPNGKPGDKGAAALKSYTESLPDDTTMLLILPRLDAAAQRTKWVKALEIAGTFVQVWPVSVAQMPRWITDRFRQAGLKVDREAVETMVERIEGNLLAAIQEIERLRLVSTDGHITLRDIVEGVTDSSRYDVFSLIDAAVAQDPRRTLKIAQGLRAEGVDILFATAMLARELRGLAGMASAINSGQTVDSAIQSARVWPKRKGIIQKCLRQHDLKSFLAAERRASKVDKMVKGMEKGDPWQELTDILLDVAGKPVFSSRPSAA